MSLGVALGGGGLKGVAHIGALKALEELGVHIDYLSGTSSGSIMAAFYAMGLTPDEMIKYTKEYYKSITTINKRPIISAIGNFFVTKKVNIPGIINGEKVENLVNKLSEDKMIVNIKDIKMPFAIITVDAISTKEYILSSVEIQKKNVNNGYIEDISIGKAVRASMAFPGIFTPCNYESYSFMDGGTKDNLPIQVLKDMGADKTLGISFKLDEYESNTNILATILRACDIFSLKDVRKAQEIADYFIEIEVKDAKLLEIQEMDYCIQKGYNTIMENKEKILELVRKEDK